MKNINTNSNTNTALVLRANAWSNHQGLLLNHTHMNDCRRCTWSEITFARVSTTTATATAAAFFVVINPKRNRKSFSFFCQFATVLLYKSHAYTFGTALVLFVSNYCLVYLYILVSTATALGHEGRCLEPTCSSSPFLCRPHSWWVLFRVLLLNIEIFCPRNRASFVYFYCVWM